ncbi:hypothetical protein RFI_28039 [Reticulomyxa filosa]|uniref:Uncharacterized protein n=1 Tax=Reticulomyxa filosa TaxID=46433 RepID=X6M5S1_RETFI|nr:hypothetical protein RFI_28039 [Reticulomyxa filosa]|eukprot:ETO09338.1 hypothetical protein RFI_28039 [Reticulomyxa filosa]
MWNVTRERVNSEQSRAVQLSIQKSDMAETSVSISTSERSTSRVKIIDVRIKWIVTLYVLGCFWVCVGNVCEPLIYALVDASGKACMHGLYVVYLRVFIEGLFYSFYLVRTTVFLQGSVFEISKCKQYFFGIAPTITFGSVLFAHNLRLQLNSCDEASIAEALLVVATIFVHMFWNVILFTFLVYHVYKVDEPFLFFFFINVYVYIYKNNIATFKKKKKITNLKSIPNDQMQKDLKEYLKKLLRLFLIAECSTLVVYAVVSVPGWSEAVWSMAAIDLCINCSTMLLSFGFANQVFASLCLCKY